MRVCGLKRATCKKLLAEAESHPMRVCGLKLRLNTCKL